MVASEEEEEDNLRISCWKESWIGLERRLWVTGDAKVAVLYTGKSRQVGRLILRNEPSTVIGWRPAAVVGSSRLWTSIHLFFLSFFSVSLHFLRLPFPFPPLSLSLSFSPITSTGISIEGGVFFCFLKNQLAKLHEADGGSVGRSVGNRRSPVVSALSWASLYFFSFWFVFFCFVSFCCVGILQAKGSLGSLHRRPPLLLAGLPFTSPVEI